MGIARQHDDRVYRRCLLYQKEQTIHGSVSKRGSPLPAVGDICKALSHHHNYCLYPN